MTNTKMTFPIIYRLSGEERILNGDSRLVLVIHDLHYNRLCVNLAHSN